MKVKVLTPTFIAPIRFNAGDIIDYYGAWGPQFSPMDDESTAVEKAYYQATPNATLDPTKDLPMTVDGNGIAPQDPRHVVIPRASMITPAATVGTEAQNATDPGLTASILADGQSLDDFVQDKLKDPGFVDAFMRAVARFQAPGDVHAKPDAPGQGSLAPTVSPEEANAEAARAANAQPKAAEPAGAETVGDPATKEKVDAANKASTDAQTPPPAPSAPKK